MVIEGTYVQFLLDYHISNFSDNFLKPPYVPPLYPPSRSSEAASAETAPNIGIAAAWGTTEVLGLVFQHSQGMVVYTDSFERNGLIAVSKAMNRMVRRAILMDMAAFHKRYPELYMAFKPHFIV